MPILETWENVDVGVNKIDDGSKELILVDSASSGRMLKIPLSEENAKTVGRALTDSGLRVATPDEIPGDAPA